ncbi:NADH:flavin oxidoreductase/NADH oxidase [Rhodococcus sp. WS4]|nr:NADH:flavin oxidoreductase/NADH oxidase [Rhodococcus sp. WS4]
MLFEPLTLRGITFPNRGWVSPMCQHSATDGCATDWHLVHLGSRAVGGAGLVMVESTAIRADGRISPYDAGLWSDQQIDSWRRITDFLRENGARSGVQLSHAGRKASTHRPWEGTGPLSADEGGWPTVAPSALAYTGFPTPHALTEHEIAEIVVQFGDAAERAHRAGFDVVEIHAAHGYLLHQFLSPLSNTRADGYGDDFDARIRLTVEVVQEIRSRLPESTPVFLRVSATDWTDGGWDLDDTIELARRARDLGVDLIDVSTGGNVSNARIPVHPGYQVGFAERIRRDAELPTAAVGLINTPEQAGTIIATGQADAVMIGRAHLDDPYWVRHAAAGHGQQVRIDQYDRPDLRKSTTSPGR